MQVSGLTKMKRIAAALSFLIGMALLAPASAQSQSEPYRNNDEYGVDLTTGSFNLTLLEGAIGPAGAGVSMIRYQGRGGSKDNWSGDLSRTIVGGQHRINIDFGNISDTFTLGSGGTWASDKANGATLTEIAYDEAYRAEYRYKAADGTQIVFKTPPLISGLFPTSGTVTYNCGQGPSTHCALPISIARPDGQLFNLSWRTSNYCAPGTIGAQNCTVSIRFAGATSASSYGFRVGYLDNGFYPSAAPPANWYVRSIAEFFDRTQVACTPTSPLCSLPADAPTVTYTYPAANILEVTTASGDVWRFTKGTSGTGAGRIVGIRRPGAVSDTTTIAYDGSGRVTSITNDGVTKTYSWGTSGANTLVDTIGGGTDSSQAVSNPTVGQPATVTSGTLQTVSYQYDANNRRTRTTMPEGNYVEVTYDARGNVTQTRQVAKSGSGLADIVTTANFDTSCANAVKCNKPNWTQDALGNRTNYTYDPTHGQVTKVQLPSPAADAAGTETGVRPEINYSYTGLKAKILQSGVLVDSTQTQYKLTQITACATAATCAGTVNETKVTIAYNDNLLPSSVTTAAGDGSTTSTTAYTYDTRGNVATVDGPLPGTADTTYYFYGPNNLYFGMIEPDPDGAGPRSHRAERRTYSDGSTLQSISIGTVTGTNWADLAGMTALQTVTYGYDANSNKVKETLSGTSGAVGVTQYSYDSKNRLLCTALRMNPATWGSLPSSACTLATMGSDGPDRITRSSYDALGRVTKVESAVGAAAAANEVRTAYTANGQVDYVIDAEDNRTTYIYDGFDRLSQTRYPVTTQGANSSNASDYEGLTYDARSSVTQRRLRDGTTIGYSYDDLGRLTAKDLPSGESDVSYSYDLMGRATGVTQGSHSLSFVQDALGRLTSQTSPLGTTGYTYDAAGRRLTMSYPGGVLTITYDYDTAGNVTKIRENGATSGVGVLASYAYDNLGRRTSVTFGNGSVQSFGYDAASRLDTLTNNLGGAATTHDLVQTFSYNPAGQIASVSWSNDAYAWSNHYNVDRGYTLDGLNRIASIGATSFSYDGRGNLTSDGTNSFSYTSENLLKTAPGGATLAYDPLGRLYQTAKSATTRFLYDGIDLIGEYDGSNAVQRRYVHGPGIDNPIAWYEGSTVSSTTRRFLMADERGSVVSVTDSAGATIAINAYDEYGIPGAGNAGRFGFTGQTWLPEVGLWYYKARMYSPTLGRFLQTDPIGYADGMNWYNYVGSDPVNGSDPTGLCVIYDGPVPAEPCPPDALEWLRGFKLEDYGTDPNEIVVTGRAPQKQGPPDRIPCRSGVQCWNNEWSWPASLQSQKKNPYCLTNNGREIRGTPPSSLDDGVVTLSGYDFDLSLLVGGGISFVKFSDAYSGSEGVMAIGSFHIGLFGAAGKSYGVAPSLPALLGKGTAFRAGAIAGLDTSYNEDGATAVETGLATGGGVATSWTRARIISSNIPGC